MFDTLLHPEYGAIPSLDEISAAGHRIMGWWSLHQEPGCNRPDARRVEAVHGTIAPLHSEAHLKGYVAVKKMLPELPQVFVFDTAFPSDDAAKA